MEMKCDLCNGTGRLLENWFDTTGALTRFKGDKCFMCGGKGKVDEAQTKKQKSNFEDITSSPERLAIFLNTLSMRCFSCGRGNSLVSELVCPFGKGHCQHKFIDNWLKQEAEEKCYTR